MRPVTITMKIGIVLAALVLVGAAHSRVSFAAPLPPIELESMSLEDLMNIPVYAASRHEQKSSEAPSWVSIVTSDEIRKYGYRTLEDLLKSVPGFYVNNDRNYSYVGVRGFGRPGDYNTRILLLVDGHRINDTVFDMAAIGTDFIVDVDLIDRVEIIRGPSSSLYGSNAFLGVINVVTRRGKNVGGVEASVDSGSFETYRGRLTYGKTYGKGLDLIASGTLYDSKGDDLFFPEFDDPETNNGVAAGRDGDKFGSAFASLSWRDFTFQAAYVDRNKDIPTASFDTVFNDPRNRTEDKRYYADLKYEGKAGEKTDLMARFFYDWYWYAGHYIYEDATVNPTPPFLYDFQDEATNAWWGGEVKLLRTLFTSHRVTAGTEVRRNNQRRQKNFIRDPYQLIMDIDKSDTVWALYLQDEWALGKGFLLNAGVRYDHYDTFGGTTNPRVALIYSPLARTTVKLLYGQAFRAPNAYELYYEGGGNKANPNLHPETIRTYEAVLEQGVGERIRLVADAFSFDIRNLIAQVTDPTDNTLVFDNIERVKAKGIELAAEGKWANGFSGRASYTIQRAEDADTGERLTNSPSSMAKLNVVVPVWSDKLFTGVELQYIADRKTPKGGAADSATVVNLTLLARNLVRGLEISGSVYNLFDKAYGVPGGEEHVQNVIPQDGRTFRIKVTASF
jgi:iron complex outermembrane receptor protein